MSPQDAAVLKAKVQGREACEKGESHNANPYPFREFNAHLAWFNAWLVRKIELEDGCKLQVTDDEKPQDNLEAG